MWPILLLRLLTSAPSIVAGIEAIHGSAKSGASKKELALQALELATGIGNVVDPSDEAALAAAKVLASQTIDGVVAVMNAAKGQAPKTPSIHVVHN